MTCTCNRSAEWCKPFFAWRRPLLFFSWCSSSSTSSSVSSSLLPIKFDQFRATTRKKNWTWTNLHQGLLVRPLVLPRRRLHVPCVFEQLSFLCLKLYVRKNYVLKQTNPNQSAWVASRRSRHHRHHRRQRPLEAEPSPPWQLWWHLLAPKQKVIWPSKVIRCIVCTLRFWFM